MAAAHGGWPEPRAVWLDEGAATDMGWRPWLGSPRSSLLPVRPARMIRKVRNRWRVWTAVRGAQGSISYTWLPLSPSLASALDAEVRLHSSAVEEEPLPILAPSPSPSSSLPFVPMPPLLETCASVSFPDTFTPEGWHAALRLTWWPDGPTTRCNEMA